MYVIRFIDGIGVDEVVGIYATKDKIPMDLIHEHSNYLSVEEWVSDKLVAPQWLAYHLKAQGITDILECDPKPL